MIKKVKNTVPWSIVELDLFNYATRTYFENSKDVDTSDFAKNIDLANLKYYVDKLNIDRWKNVPSGLR